MNTGIVGRIAAEALRAVGVEVAGGKAVLFRGTDVPGLTPGDLRYGDYLSAVPAGVDATGNAGADTYGKYVVRYEIPVENVSVTNGELQYKGPSKSLTSGYRYPEEIYRAYCDATGGNWTAEEIDRMPHDEVRMNASMAMSGGRRQFDELLGRHMFEKRTYYLETDDRWSDGKSEFLASSDEEAVNKARELSHGQQILCLYRESDTENGLPFIEIETELPNRGIQL